MTRFTMAHGKMIKSAESKPLQTRLYPSGKVLKLSCTVIFYLSSAFPQSGGMQLMLHFLKKLLSQERMVRENQQYVSSCGILKDVMQLPYRQYAGP